MRQRPTRKRGTLPAKSITHAQAGLTADLRDRTRRYLIAMLIRTACVVTTAATWSRWPALAIGTLIGAAIIPCAAVMAAQAHWRQQRGTRHRLAKTSGHSEQPAPRAVIEPTLILPPESTDP